MQAVFVTHRDNPYGTWNGEVFLGKTSHTYRGKGRVSIGERKEITVDRPHGCTGPRCTGATHRTASIKATVEVVCFVPSILTGKPYPQLRVVKCPRNAPNTFVGLLLSEKASERWFA